MWASLQKGRAQEEKQKAERKELEKDKGTEVIFVTFGLTMRSCKIWLITLKIS
jgi:hypothetical protein